MICVYKLAHDSADAWEEVVKANNISELLPDIRRDLILLDACDRHEGKDGWMRSYLKDVGLRACKTGDTHYYLSRFGDTSDFEDLIERSA